jgi:hypothetical protein
MEQRMSDKARGAMVAAYYSSKNDPNCQAVYAEQVLSGLGTVFKMPLLPE